MAPVLLAASLLALGCGGCESSQEESARLASHAKHQTQTERGVSVGKQSPHVQVLSSTVVHSREGAAIVVQLRDTSSKPLESAPIAVQVSDAKGAQLFHNDQPGEDPSLTHVSLLQPGVKSVWVDDQVQSADAPTIASARVGEGTSAEGSPPQMSVVGLHESGEGVEAGAAGSVKNDSSVTQANLVIYVVARKGARIVAAGRAVLAELAAGASAPFQLYFIGDPSGAKIEASAPATTF